MKTLTGNTITLKGELFDAGIPSSFTHPLAAFHLHPSRVSCSTPASLHLSHTLWLPFTYTHRFLCCHPHCSSSAWWNADFREDPGLILLHRFPPLLPQCMYIILIILIAKSRKSTEFTHALSGQQRSLTCVLSYPIPFHHLQTFPHVEHFYAPNYQKQKASRLEC